MRRKSWYRLHKWIAVGSGVALLVWCASGLAMLLPHLHSSVLEGPRPQTVGPSPDYSAATVSPAQAVEALAASGEASKVRYADLRPVGDRMAYDLRLEDGTRSLVDAGTAERFDIDSTMAVALARHGSGSTSEVVGHTRIEAPTAAYPLGDLPAYTIVFANAPQITFSVSIHTGEVLRTAPLGRIRGMIERTHTFRQLDRVMPDAVTYWTVALFGVLTALATLIGFTLAIPRPWLPGWLGGSARGGHTDEVEDGERLVHD